MIFDECQFNYLRGERKLQQKEVLNTGINIYHPFILNNTLRNIKSRKIFHSTESQHFKLINVGFFLYIKI